MPQPPAPAPVDDALVLVARSWLPADEIALLRELASRGARIVAWQHRSIVQERFPSPDVESYLRREGIAAVSLPAALGESEDAAVDDAVIAWFKEFGRTPLGADGSFREIYRHRDLALWWWAELFLYHDTELRLWLRDVEALASLLEKEKPRRLILVSPVRRLAEAVRAFFPDAEIRGEPPRSASGRFRTAARFAAFLVKTMGTGFKSLFVRERGEGGEASPRILFLTHGSMWRTTPDPATGAERRVDLYFEDLPARLSSTGASVKMIGVGPSVPFRRRTRIQFLKDAVELSRKAREPFVPIRSYFSIALAFRVVQSSLRCVSQWCDFERRCRSRRELVSHRGVVLADGALPCFRETFLLQLPWAIRSFHEVATALRAEKPDLLVLYAESSGLGRAAIAAAAECGVASFALQHGIAYPRLFAAEHDGDEVGEGEGGASVPIPTCTAVFGTMARDLLVERGHYPPERIVVTGSPKFDALARAGRELDRDSIRRRLGIAKTDRMLLIASRFSAIGPVFGELVAAVENIPGLLLLVKPHQAELREPYLEVVARENATRVRVLDMTENLVHLLLASEGLVTVDSFVSSEALVLGRPVLVVNLPSNLGELVRRGFALGVVQGEPIEAQLRRLLFDPEVAPTLEARRRDYLQEFAFGADGRSTARIVDVMLWVAKGRRNGERNGVLGIVPAGSSKREASLRRT
ncbi:MAG: hypothetical protein ACRD21_03535 [Vicinamibacteria bacterium]